MLIGIQMKQKSRDNITSLVKDNDINFWSYLTAHNNRIYQTDHNNQTVTCYKINGDKVWEFKDTNVIKKPLGITVDHDSNGYVGTGDHKVVLLSPDGKMSRILLTSDERLNYPNGIFFDKIKNMLQIETENCFCTMYRK